MTTINASLAIQNTDNNDLVRDLFAEGTEASAHTWFKAIRCLVNTVTKLDSASKKLGLNPDEDGVLVYKNAVTVGSKLKTEWGFNLGDFYITYKAAATGLATIRKGDEILFEGPWPQLKDFLRAEKAEKPASTPAKAPAETPVKAEVKAVAAPVVETEVSLPNDKIADIIDNLAENDEEDTGNHGIWVRDHRDQYWDADEAERNGADAFDSISTEY